MQVQITLRQQNTVEPPDVYQVINTIEATIGIPMALFVFRTSDDSYNRIASVLDIETYPESKAEAVSLDADYYRGPTSTNTFPLIVNAENFARVVQTSLQTLAANYRRYKDNFAGDAVFTYNSEA